MQVQQGRFSCSFCGSPNDTFIDPSQGPDQEYIEDCQTCCAPNQLRLSWQESTSSWEMHSSEY
nr:CPXCG motif-containing cysteine-rich protein [Cyclonatronum proteinivorum]